LVAVFERAHGVWVHPANPQLRLWPDSVQLLFGRPDALPRLTPNWDKRKLDLMDRRFSFQGEPLPLALIYVLAERRDDLDLPRVGSGSGRDKLMALVGNTYLNSLLDADMRGQEFRSLHQFVTRIPMRFVSLPGGHDYLQSLIDVILHDLEALSLAPPMSDPRISSREALASPVAPA
jgi:hypothetical protein